MCLLRLTIKGQRSRSAVNPINGGGNRPVQTDNLLNCVNEDANADNNSSICTVISRHKPQTSCAAATDRFNANRVYPQ